MDANVGWALLITAIAGLSTTIGSILGLWFKDPGPRFISATLGFSAGVMILVSFVELLASSLEDLGFGLGLIGFFAGMFLMLLIDNLIPHEYFAEKNPSGDEGGRMYRTGLLVALGIGIHNFPEGMATFAGALQDLRLGIAIGVAIAIHNIPEGLAVSTPIYLATGSRKKAFWWSFLSGVAEPAGALIAALFLMRYINDTVLGWVLAIVAGIMVYISMDELIPASREYGEDNYAITGAIAGMAVMAFSLWLL
ncbi:MAG: zinc transporter ZupT [Actinobacteria bacterium]|nr:zinc transporter ZupT [Actinomycetota bacterium]